jgi:tRNA U34 5-methylaminomethyl-2-thiouridine-forming methyltransferase MnmC
MVQDGLFITGDGSHSIESKQFGVPYHSRNGAVQETFHVFIKAALHPQSKNKQALSILDIGFGTGLNALATLTESQKLALLIDYTAVEAFPLPISVVEQLNYIEQLQIPALAGSFMEMHHSPWEQTHQITSQFSLTKLKQRFESLQFTEIFDIIYYDAFAPNAQPELWEESMMNNMHIALKKNGVLTTYCAKGAFKRTLKKIGFQVEAMPGPPGKREMTRAWKR